MRLFDNQLTEVAIGFEMLDRNMGHSPAVLFGLIDEFLQAAKCSIEFYITVLSRVRKYSKRSHDGFLEIIPDRVNEISGTCWATINVPCLDKSEKTFFNFDINISPTSPYWLETVNEAHLIVMDEGQGQVLRLADYEKKSRHANAEAFPSYLLAATGVKVARDFDIELLADWQADILSRYLERIPNPDVYVAACVNFQEDFGTPRYQNALNIPSRPPHVLWPQLGRRIDALQSVIVADVSTCRAVREVLLPHAQRASDIRITWTSKAYHWGQIAILRIHRDVIFNPEAQGAVCVWLPDE